MTLKVDEDIPNPNPRWHAASIASCKEIPLYNPTEFLLLYQPETNRGLTLKEIKEARN
jgi:hypothetical protein